MKFSHSIVFFFVIMLVASGLFLFFSKHQAAQNQTLLQSLDCHSEKIDQKILSFSADTKTIGALVEFDKTPINKTLRHQIEDLDIKFDDTNWILDYGRLEIPTKKLCHLVKFSEVKRIFIPVQQYDITASQ